MSGKMPAMSGKAPYCTVYCTGSSGEPVWHRSEPWLDYDAAYAEAEEKLASGEWLKCYCYAHEASVQLGLPEGYSPS